MDTKTILGVVAWIKSREHDEKAFDDDTPPYGPITGTPAEIFFQFCAHPDVVLSYPDKLEKRVPNGCNFVHRIGELRGLSCGAPKGPESNRCPFHSQIVFSEKVQDNIRICHEQINKAFLEQD